MSDSSPFAGGYPTGAVLASMLIFTVLGMGMVSVVMAFVRRTRGWIVAAIVLSLLGGAGAITGVVFAVRGVGKVFAQRSQPKTVVSDDGSVRLQIPGTWDTLPELDDESTVKVGNKFREEYALLQSANKADFDSTLDDFAKAVIGAIEENLEGGAEVGAIENAMAGKFPARRCRLAGKVENIRVVYFHYTIETPQGFHQLLMWTLPSKESKARPVFERVAGSFEEVNPPPKSDVPEKMVKASPRTPQTGTVEERLRGIFVEQLGIPAEKVKPEARLKEDLGADDLDLVELVMASEEEFDIEISDDDAEKLATVGRFTEYVSGKVK